MENYQDKSIKLKDERHRNNYLDQVLNPALHFGGKVPATGGLRTVLKEGKFETVCNPNVLGCVGFRLQPNCLLTNDDEIHSDIIKVDDALFSANQSGNFSSGIINLQSTNNIAPNTLASARVVDFGVSIIGNHSANDAMPMVHAALKVQKPYPLTTAGQNAFLSINAISTGNQFYKVQALAVDKEVISVWIPNDESDTVLYAPNTATADRNNNQETNVMWVYVTGIPAGRQITVRMYWHYECEPNPNTPLIGCETDFFPSGGIPVTAFIQALKEKPLCNSLIRSQWLSLHDYPHYQQMELESKHVTSDRNSRTNPLPNPDMACTSLLAIFRRYLEQSISIILSQCALQNKNKFRGAQFRKRRSKNNNNYNNNYNNGYQGQNVGNNQQPKQGLQKKSAPQKQNNSK